ncbi:AfsR/SARP family transcriptional regulator [Deinococcus cellulosilyticus]|uniref:Bacterial transcriptional activator domain-containing protein n=1 Tax=Deinococcus cellulosilyticus (strain DSM 18568 / NBRC 106333 / KACC 11606 / 5516J-15) TaxID=1223518 RepID=A0A511MW92_DEIC1|nr:BTAD domain-containing putative transcriptional regulator [Deinococcus cellulosilyticus]GEM44528.1 hypothetical protein DC3_01630 [Deinococcus cellulosilyticus NBRC 106333 = KACC 11606]
MHEFHILTLGTAQVQHLQQDVSFHSESARDILFYLLSHPEGRSKGDLLRDLWEEEATPAVNNRLRVNLHRIRSALGATGTLREQQGRLQLAPEVLQSSDLHQFYTLVNEAQLLGGQARLDRLHEALKLCQGPFLAGLQGSWMEEAREQHQQAYLKVLMEVSDLHCLTRDCLPSVNALHQALKTDPFLGENHHQRLMACLAVAQDRYAAIAHYRRFLHFLKQDIEDTPMLETVQLAESIKAGQGCCPRDPAASATLPPPVSCPFGFQNGCQFQAVPGLEHLQEIPVN